MAKLFLIQSDDDDAVYLVDVEAKTVERMDDDQAAQVGVPKDQPIVRGVSLAVAAQSVSRPVSRQWFEA
jgi:hypothetical protein